MTVQPLFETLDRPTLASATDRRELVSESPGPTAAAPTTPPAAPVVLTPLHTTTPQTTSEANRSQVLRTQFLRRVAHDIASPTGLTMTVLEELAAASSRPELVAMARRGLRRLLRLSEQLALASDIESGTEPPETSAEDIRAIVKDALDQAVTVDGRRDIVTTSELLEEKVIVDVDRRLVTSLLREIIGNALRLASSRVAIDMSLGGGKAIIRVQDDGPGFSSDALENVGQRFNAGSTTRGLGLSLSIAKDILSAHGGELTFDVSSLPPGRRSVRGAAVIVMLPLCALNLR